MGRSGAWTLAPGYDLTCAPGPGAEHTTPVAGEGRSPTREHLRKVAGAVNPARAQADRVLSEVWDAVSRWPDFARDAGVTAETARIVEARIRA